MQTDKCHQHWLVSLCLSACTTYCVRTFWNTCSWPCRGNVEEAACVAPCTPRLAGMARQQKCRSVMQDHDRACTVDTYMTIRFSVDYVGLNTLLVSPKQGSNTSQCTRGVIRVVQWRSRWREENRHGSWKRQVGAGESVVSRCTPKEWTKGVAPTLLSTSFGENLCQSPCACCSLCRCIQARFVR
eukprot:1011745-Amphidinium_carterae.2